MTQHPEPQTSPRPRRHIGPATAMTAGVLGALEGTEHPRLYALSV